jgi:LruC domain-containing protein
MQQSSIAALVLCLTCAPALAWSQDGDGDGVFDTSDARPCDGTVTAVSYAPAQDDHGMLLFEDQFPSQGDNDFNDVVISYQYRLEHDAQGHAVRLVALFNAPAMGGNINSGAGLHLPLPATSVSSVTRTIEGAAQGNLTPAGDSEFTVRWSNDLRAELYVGAPGPVNVAGPAVQGKAMELVISFVPGTTFDLVAAPFDLFVFRTQAPSHEVHLPNFAGTALMNAALFGTADDGSSPGRSFVDKRGLPFALHLPTQTAYPVEGVAIDQVYPNILNFAASGGATDTDFFVTQVVLNSAFGGSVNLGVVNPETIDTSCVVPGLDPANPGTMCVDLQAAGATADGYYWIDPDGLGGAGAFQAYCDMTTAGGGWTGIIADVDQSLAYLSRFNLVENTVVGYSVNGSYGATWGTFTSGNAQWGSNPFRVVVAVPYNDLRITYSGFYNSPSGGLGTMQVGNENAPGNMISFSDGHTDNSAGQSLTVSGTRVMSLSPTNIVNRTDQMSRPASTRLRVSMNAYTSSYSYTRRYIHSVWVR